MWHSVPQRAFYGTEYVCRAKNGFLVYGRHFQKLSVLKTGFWGTEGIFGTGNPLLRYGTRLTINSPDSTPNLSSSVIDSSLKLVNSKYLDKSFGNTISMNWRSKLFSLVVIA